MHKVRCIKIVQSPSEAEVDDRWPPAREGDDAGYVVYFLGDEEKVKEGITYTETQPEWRRWEEF